jgi:molybdenum cofactor cytidylyltransferase
MTAARHGAVVLAAGGSTRLGRPKQLLELGGEALVRRAARLAGEAGFAPVIVVVGGGPGVGDALTGGAFVVVMNPDWRSGVASTIRRGLEALSALRPDAEGALLATCDQPLVEAAHLAALAAALVGGGPTIAASSYAGTVGVPALFSRSILGELRALEGEHGAKGVITREPGRVVQIALPGGECDIDTEADWLALLDRD